MSDALSYVYRGREGTGVAQVLKQPTPVAPPKPDTKFLDSLGEDIRNGGTVWEVDRPKVIEARNELVDLMSKVYASDKDPKRYPEVAKMLLDKQQQYKDLISKSQRDLKEFEKTELELKRNPDLYPDDAINQLYKRKETPLADITPPQRYSTKDVADVYNTGANHYKSEKFETTDKEGKKITSYKDVFQTDEAKQVWNEYANANQGTAPFVKAFKITYKDLEDEMGNAFATKTEQEKGALVNKKMEDNYLLFSSAKKRNQGQGFKAAPEDKTKDGEGDGTSPINIEGDYFTSWKYDANGKLIKRVSWNVNPSNKNLKDTENLLSWTDTDGTVYKSKLVRPSVDELGNVSVIVSVPKYEDNGITMTKVGEFEKELPLTGTNKGYLAKFYKFDVDKVLSKDASWRSAIDNMPLPSVKDFPTNKSPNQQKKIQEAIDKRKGSTPAPKAETTNTKIDPQDEQFFRK